MQVWARVLLMGIGFAITVMGIAIACVLDREAGAFECPECKERFVPDMKSYVMGPHTITKRTHGQYLFIREKNLRFSIVA